MPKVFQQITVNPELSDRGPKAECTIDNSKTRLAFLRPQAAAWIAPPLLLCFLFLHFLCPRCSLHPAKRAASFFLRAGDDRRHEGAVVIVLGWVEAADHEPLFGRALACDDECARGLRHWCASRPQDWGVLGWGACHLTRPCKFTRGVQLQFAVFSFQFSVYSFQFSVHWGFSYSLQFSVFSFQLQFSVFSFQLQFSVFSFQFSVFSFQFSTSVFSFQFQLLVFVRAVGLVIAFAFLFVLSSHVCGQLCACG